MTQLDTDALAQITGAVQRGRLSPKEKIAVYAFTQRGVPAKILARAFHVNQNAIYYSTLWEHTAAYRYSKAEFDRMGEERVWAEIITPAQIEQVNAGINLVKEGKFNDRRYSRVNRSRLSPRRTRAAPNLPEAASDEPVASPAAD